jgi:beta-glucosidase
MKLIERVLKCSSEASADGINWTFSPMVDVSRDPRWGRVSEGSGEDAYLGSQIAKAMVRGINKMICQKQFDFIHRVKHFALYGASEGS